MWFTFLLIFEWSYLCDLLYGLFWKALRYLKLAYNTTHYSIKTGFLSIKHWTPIVVYKYKIRSPLDQNSASTCVCLGTRPETPWLFVWCVLQENWVSKFSSHTNNRTLGGYRKYEHYFYFVRTELNGKFKVAFN